MSRRTIVSPILGLMAFLSLASWAHPQWTEEAARAQAGNVSRQELERRVNFKKDDFLNVQRDEELEQSLAIAVGGRAGLQFIYKVSPEGYEIKENAVLPHVWCDFNPEFIVVVNPTNGSTYRIHGFGIEESLSEFHKLMAALKVRVSSGEQAESIAEFYREVNPRNFGSLTPISNMLGLKQAAERQCQGGATSFDAGEKEFTAWWKRAKPHYQGVQFQQTTKPSRGGYLVEWIVLSAQNRENCGGAPLRVRLEVASDGHVSKETFSPINPP